ncbi:MAG: B12-binding domain-containing radical SAM protein [Planctomycetota bacterium]|jgi:anaerobic magnesium-protoporphyrin IX monomethyl ester cyclase
MKILLVNPPYHGWFYLFGVRIPPLGLGYLASALRDAGASPTILDLAVAKPEEIPAFGDFDIVGVGTDTTRFKYAVDIAKQAKKAGATVVMGGPHPTVVDDAPLKTGAVDYVVRSEGEETLTELAHALAKGKDPQEITGLTYLRKGSVFRTPDRPFREDLDDLAWPARDLLAMDRYRSAKIGQWPLTPVVTSRGCPYRCTFCASSHMNGPKWRARKAEKVVDEIEEVTRRWGYPAVAFSDDNSTLDPKRTERICDEIIRRGLDVKIWLFCRADTVLRHPALVPRMAKAGVTSVFMGIESLRAEDLREIKKGFGPEAAPEAVRLLRAHQIDVLGSYIIGYADETLSQVRETVRHARSIPTSTAQFTILTPYPGTVLFDQVKDRIRSWNWAHYDGYHAVFKTRGISRFALQMMLLYAHLGFYVRSLESIGGFARFTWRRKRDLSAIRKVFRDMFFTKAVEPQASGPSTPEETEPANSPQG